MKIRSSDKCVQCNVTETIEHFFYYCSRRKKIWEYVSNTISFLFSRRIQITWEKAILGIVSEDGFSKNEMKLINNILLIAKLAISKSEYGSKQDACIILENELILRKILH